MRYEVLILTFSCLTGTALGHGYLAEPPGRASAWRYGFDTPVDWNDNECFCGGFNYQYGSMGGKCGLCGDPWNQSPRDHEVGGRYATGTIVRNYVQGQVIQTIGNVTTNHLGHFEYKICANNDVTVEATQECLDLTPLYAVGRNDWHLNIGSAKGPVKFDLQLPADLTCTQCVIQWRYVAANTWGTCENGTDALGCGPQEEFRGCADVSISPDKTTSVGEQQKALKLVEEMAAAVKNHAELQPNEEQAIDEEPIPKTGDDDEDDDVEENEDDDDSDDEDGDENE